MPHEPIGHGESAEMYLKSIHELMDESETVPISSLAERLDITVVSATEMVHRMQDQELVEHVPYRGVNLTKEGLFSARAILRRQRLWECLLYEELGLPWDRVYDLACKLEHAAGPEVTEALATHLNEPDRCPHGNPIPTSQGEVEPFEGHPLSDMQVGERAILRRIEPSGASSLTYLLQHGLVPGVQVTLKDLEPIDGLRTLRTEAGEAVLGRQLAGQIYVESEAN